MYFSQNHLKNTANMLKKYLLLRNKMFMLDEMFQQNASKFDIFLE